MYEVEKFFEILIFKFKFVLLLLTKNIIVTEKIILSYNLLEKNKQIGFQWKPESFFSKHSEKKLNPSEQQNEKKALGVFS